MTIDGDAVRADNMAIQPEFIAVQPGDVDDDGWETEEDEDADDDEVENPLSTMMRCGKFGRVGTFSF